MIEVENLSKKYKIGTSQPYLVFREELMKKLNITQFFKRNKTENERDIFWALKDINFTVDKGDILGVIGKNGAGKSTLLKILTRITYPTEGIIKIRGRVGSLLEVGTGFHPELTGRENVFLNGAILGMTRKEIQRKFDTIVDFSGITKFLDTPVKRYSSGMAVRLGFAVAAHLEPEILLIDEVLSVGDYEFQQKCLGKMDDVSQQTGRTILFVSHNLDAVQRICNRVLVLDEGKFSFLGSTDEGIQHYLSLISSEKKTKVDRIVRSGKGNIQISNVAIIDKHNQEVNSIKLGDKMKLRFDYNSKESNFDGIDIGITLNDELNKRVANLSSKYVSKSLKISKKKGSFYLSVPRVLLYPGVYQLNIGLQRNNIAEDKIYNLKEFIVEKSPIFGREELPPRQHQRILFDYSWEVR